MVVVACDICGAKKPMDALPGAVEWILGTDLEVETARSLRRQLTFYDRWDDRRVLELGSIHLCSEACRQEYIENSKAA